MSGNDMLAVIILALATVVLGWGLVANYTIRDDWAAVYARLPRWARRTLVGVAGVAILALAVALSPLPGPGGLPLAYLALTILGFEFAFALKIRERIDGWVKGAWARIKELFGRQA